MHPAFSVIFLTTLIGAGQGLFLALFLVESLALIGLLPTQSSVFYVSGSLISLLFLIAGLIASIFHLGRPERAWRSATMWRTSWLSREVIALPAFMLTVFLYAAFHYSAGGVSVAGLNDGIPSTVIIGIIGVILCFLLFICTGMIYACIKFLQEWHTPFTPINYSLLGIMSGLTLAVVHASLVSPTLTKFYVTWVLIVTVIALVFRVASLIRNKNLKLKSSVQTALGIRHNKITQKTTGSMGGSFNTREFFHGKPPEFFVMLKWFFLGAAFGVPFLILAMSLNSESFILFTLVFLIQYIGLVAERWFFFAQSNHPQNLYYQSMS